MSRPVHLPPAPPADFRARLRHARERIDPHERTRRVAAEWGMALSLLGLLLVVHATLFPFNFDRTLVKTFDWHPFDPGDIEGFVENVALFVPLGFGLTVLGRRLHLRRRGALIAAVAACAIISTCIELLQLHLPTRVSELSDIVSNTTGGLVGAAFFTAAGVPLLAGASDVVGRINRRLPTPALAAAAAIWLLAALLAPLHLKSPASLGNWDRSMPLMLGNERTGNRPWNGFVYRFDIGNRALSEPEIARGFALHSFLGPMGPSLRASYAPGGEPSLEDRSGRLPPLVWRGQVQPLMPGQPIQLSESHWLATAKPVKELTDAIAGSSQLTIYAVAAAGNTDQSGPARIISISRNTSQTDLTLGQSGPDLVVRVRTPIIGDTGSRPQWMIPNVFADTLPHEIVVTYARCTLRAYIDGMKRSAVLVLPPELTLVRRFMVRPTIDIRAPESLEMYRVLYFILTLAPLGLLTGWLANRAGSNVPRRALLAGIMLAPPLLIAIIVAHVAQQPFAISSVLLGLAVLICTALPAERWFKSWPPPVRARRSAALVENG